MTTNEKIAKLREYGLGKEKTVYEEIIEWAKKYDDELVQILSDNENSKNNFFIIKKVF